MRTPLAVAASVSLALCATTSALAGDGPTGIGIRVVEIQAQEIILSTVFDKTETIRTFDVNLGDDASSRMVFGLEVTGGGDELNLNITTGYVMIRDITNATNTEYTSVDTDPIPLADGSYMVTAGPEADLAMTWAEEAGYSDGDMTIESLDGRNASVTFHPAGDTGALWLGTNGATASELTATFRVFDETAERSMVWVNDVTGSGGFTMPDEASDQVQTAFPAGDHSLELGQHSLLSIVLDREDDGGSDGGLQGDLNNDCLVDGADLGLLLTQFGNNCP
ncbi:MAG: hypothetical protein MK085_02605 [Phycisphaerales bacterium]|nr:hypothetical protein [Phycisphaerales bacterium]